jgi:aminoglycoside 6'-N-acetyltransferase I
VQVEIVRVQPDNLALLDRVDPECFDEPTDRARAARCVASPDVVLVVAVVDGLVIGQCLARIHRHPDKPTSVYVDDLAVSPDHQRQGVATRLVQACLAHAGDADDLWVATEPDNDAARALYLALGLEPREALVFEGSARARAGSADRIARR